MLSTIAASCSCFSYGRAAATEFIRESAAEFGSAAAVFGETSIRSFRGTPSAALILKSVSTVGHFFAALDTAEVRGVHICLKSQRLLAKAAPAPFLLDLLPIISEIYSLDVLFLRLPCAPLTAFFHIAAPPFLTLKNVLIYNYMPYIV